MGHPKSTSALLSTRCTTFWRTFYGWHLIYLGRYDEAIENLQDVLKFQSQFLFRSPGTLGALLQKHMDKQAYAEAVRFFEVLNDHEAVYALHAGFAAAGYREAMKRAGDVLAARSQRTTSRASASHASTPTPAKTILPWPGFKTAVDAKETPTSHLAVAWDGTPSAPTRASRIFSAASISSDNLCASLAAGQQRFAPKCLCIWSV